MDPITNVENAGMLTDACAFGYVDIGDDIGDASDTNIVGSLVDFSELGGNRATVPNPHVGRAQSDSKQIFNLISPCFTLSPIRVTLVLGARFKIEEVLVDAPGKELVIQQPVEKGMATASQIRVPGQFTDVKAAGRWGDRLMLTAVFTPTGEMTTTVGNVLSP